MLRWTRRGAKDQWLATVYKGSKASRGARVSQARYLPAGHRSARSLQVDVPHAQGVLEPAPTTKRTAQRKKPKATKAQHV